MNLMGLDPATNTGFAICGDDGQIHTTGKWSPKAKWSEKSTESKDTINARIANEARRWIMTMIKVRELHAVGFEDLKPIVTNPKDGKAMAEPISRNKQAAIQMGLRMGCDALSIPFYPFADSTWRKTFLGYGKIVHPKNLSTEELKAAREAARNKLKEDARLKCDELQISAKSEDAREAAGVLFHLQVFLDHPRHQSTNAGPLFQEAAA